MKRLEITLCVLLFAIFTVLTAWYAEGESAEYADMTSLHYGAPR